MAKVEVYFTYDDKGATDQYSVENFLKYLNEEEAIILYADGQYMEDCRTYPIKYIKVVVE